MGLAEKIYEKLKEAPDAVAQEVLDFIDDLETQKKLKHKPKNTFDSYIGCLKDSEAFKGDPLEIQRKLRAEWDREWDK